MSTLSGGGKANELTFQHDMIRQLVANGWLLGTPERFNCELSMLEEDVLSFGHCIEQPIDYYHLDAMFARLSIMRSVR